tara:strand:- start:277 stop:480 length:204 start_codon:yes stop_codon:yes gene_type:complete
MLRVNINYLSYLVILTILFAKNLLANEPLKKDEGYLVVSFNVEEGYLPYKVSIRGDGFFHQILILKI